MDGMRRAAAIAAAILRCVGNAPSRHTAECAVCGRHVCGRHVWKLGRRLPPLFLHTVARPERLSLGHVVEQRRGDEGHALAVGVAHGVRAQHPAQPPRRVAYLEVGLGLGFGFGFGLG